MLDLDDPDPKPEPYPWISLLWTFVPSVCVYFALTSARTSYLLCHRHTLSDHAWPRESHWSICVVHFTQVPQISSSLNRDDDAPCAARARDYHSLHQRFVSRRVRRRTRPY